MEKKYYYTYREILYALRVEYQKNQKLLDKLKKMIEVITNKECQYSLRIKQGNIFYQMEDYPTLLLRVTKKQRKLKEEITKLEDSILLDDLRWRKTHADFIYKDGNFYPGFYAHNFKNGTKYFNPSVIINDEKGFKKVYQELQKSELFQMPEASIALNHFQDIDIMGHKIKLNTKEGFAYREPDITISYRAEDDSVHLKQKGYHNYFMIDSLLNTKVPSYSIPVGYLDIIERNLRPDFIEKHIDSQFFEKEDIIPLFDKPKVYTKN